MTDFVMKTVLYILTIVLIIMFVFIVFLIIRYYKEFPQTIMLSNGLLELTDHLRQKFA
ncbi:MAG: hypothetical protein ACFFDN_13620 [Candidatus Hodarchaeota archaeon]